VEAKDIANGIGLGLPIAQEIAVSHGAEIQISEGYGSMGTIVSVIFHISLGSGLLACRD
jgi:nitrogen fixation/metabolism regulation signal transduction histidine kinase